MISAPTVIMMTPAVNKILPCAKGGVCKADGGIVIPSCQIQPKTTGRQMENENRRRPERWRSGIGISVLLVERFSPLMKGKYGVTEKSKRFFGEEERQANG